MTPNELEDCKAYLEDKIFISRTAAKATSVQLEAEYRNNRARMLEIALWAVNQLSLPETLKKPHDKNALCCSDCDVELGSILIFCPSCLIRHQSPENAECEAVAGE
jgi:hypothetical protein